MAQSAVKVLFSSRHDTLGRELNQWLGEVSGQVSITGMSMDSNKFGHCLTLMYQSGEGGRHYRGHLFFHSSHSSLEADANRGLTAAGATWGRLVAIGSNEYGHCLCLIEEQ